MSTTPDSQAQLLATSARLPAARPALLRRRRSPIAAPKVPTTNASNSSAIRCSTCCCPERLYREFPDGQRGRPVALRARLVSEEPLGRDRAGDAARRTAVAGFRRTQDRRFPPPVHPRRCLRRRCAARCTSTAASKLVRSATSGPMFEPRIAALPEPSTLKDAKTASAGAPAGRRPAAAGVRRQAHQRRSRMRRSSWSPAPCRTRRSRPRARVRAAGAPNRWPRRQRCARWAP